jgi:ATPase subunit of ABC transporter with duplicated ATPase domains
MLNVQHLSKSYGLDIVLKDVSFTLNAGERVGLVGPNGSGKTTLLRILASLEQPDSGHVQWNPPGLRMGYLPQGLLPSPEETMQGFLSLPAFSLPELEAQIEKLAASLVGAPNQPILAVEYDRLLAQMEAASAEAGRLESVLAALDLGRFPPETLVASLSGGQKTRLALARVLLLDPQLLLLDEPTNHLDMDMLAWLEEWLLAFRGAALVVSHDRAFLDRTATAILELDMATHTARLYGGDYSAYVEEKLAETERGWQAYNDQQSEIARLKRAAAGLRNDARFKRGGKADTNDKFAKGFFSDRSKGTVARARHIERRLVRLQGEERVEKPKLGWQMKLDFGEMPSSGKAVLHLEDLAVGYGSTIVLEGVNQHLVQGARVALIGPNGAGKTTLLRTIAARLEPLAGSIRLGANVRVGYMAQEQEGLDPGLDALTTLRSLALFGETEARAFLHQYLFSRDDVFVPVRSLSYGERARLSLACLVAGGCNLLLLDEPVNHLDIPSRQRFEQALQTFSGTLLVASHDRYFIESFASEVWEIRDQPAAGSSKLMIKRWTA